MSGLAPLATPDRRSTKYKWAPRDQALRSQGSLGEEGFSRVARGGEVDRFQCSLRPGPDAALGPVSLRVLKRGPGRR